MLSNELIQVERDLETSQAVLSLGLCRNNLLYFLRLPLDEKKRIINYLKYLKKIKETNDEDL